MFGEGWEEDENDDADEYTSPIDDIDELLFFSDTLKLHSKGSQSYDLWDTNWGIGTTSQPF